MVIWVSSSQEGFNILLHTQSIVCATLLGQWLEYLVYITLPETKNVDVKVFVQIIIYLLVGYCF